MPEQPACRLPSVLFSFLSVIPPPVLLNHRLAAEETMFSEVLSEKKKIETNVAAFQR